MREDFYYRIKVVSLQVPPLRERRDDIPLLVAHILGQLRGRQIPVPVPAQDVSPEAMARLLRHRWPGNVRELQHALEHAQVLSRGQTLQPVHLPPEVGQTVESSLLEVPRHSLEERDLIRAELERNGWNRSRTARKLGIDRTTLWRKIREYDLEPHD
jgi:DNA-binding NtrC family response regulator